MTLVRTLKGDSIRTDLERAYIALSRVLLSHRGGGSFSVKEAADPMLLDELLCSTELPVDLRVVRATCDLIAQDEERPGEIFNNLCHMFVLMQAATIMTEDLSLKPLACAPTQQSDCSDLEGSGWVLEAFGGVNVSNNGKLAKDLRELARSASAGNRVFLAVREDAWRLPRGLPDREWRNITAQCPLSHGGPFSMSAKVTLRGRRNGVAVIEAHSIREQSGTE
ncbi:MAG: hypothetical protein ACLQPD_16400 [Desulfomonilaceae bacterium]